MPCPYGFCTVLEAEGQTTSLRKEKGAPTKGAPFPFTRRLRTWNNYSWSKLKPGRTGVPSDLTASRAFGSRPSTFRMVGAT